MKKTTQKLECRMNTTVCVRSDGQMNKSHHGLPLADRIGKEVAQTIITNLTGTPFESMLNLEAKVWPKNGVWPSWAQPIPERKRALRRKNVKGML